MLCLHSKGVNHRDVQSLTVGWGMGRWDVGKEINIDRYRKKVD